jgi:hypothetical protein
VPHANIPLLLGLQEFAKEQQLQPSRNFIRSVVVSMDKVHTVVSASTFGLEVRISVSAAHYGQKLKP